MLGCHFRSERLDSLSKVTQDSGLKANLAVRRLENGETVRKLYFGRMQYALRVQVGTEMREYLRVIWYGKPQYDVAHGLWLVKKDAVLSDKWRPFVRLQDVTGQVFYGDDPREPSIRVVLQKELGLENIARAAGDASDFARSAVPKSEADEQAFGVGEKPAAGFGERGDPKDGEAEVGKPAKAEAGHRGLEANADRNSQSVAGKPLRKRRRNGKAEKPEPKTRRAAVRASAPQNLSSDDEEEAARVANENEVVEKPLHVLQALQNLKPSGRLPLPTGLKSCLEWLDAEVGPETVMSKLPDAASKVRGQEIVIRARDLATLKANMELNDQVIDAGVALIARYLEQRSAGAVGGPSVSFVSSLFHQRYSENGLRGVSRWADRLHLQAPRTFWMINKDGNHWVLAEASDLASRPCLQIFDSLGGTASDSSCIQVIKNFYREKLGADPDAWAVTEADCPQQGSGTSDCGVYLPQFLRMRVQGKKLAMTRKQVAYWRRVLALEILKGSLFD